MSWSKHEDTFLGSGRRKGIRLNRGCPPNLALDLQTRHLVSGLLLLLLLSSGTLEFDDLTLLSVAGGPEGIDVVHQIRGR